MQEIKFDHAIKKYMDKPESVLENEMFKILKGFRDLNESLKSGKKARDSNRSPNISQTTRPSDGQQKKKKKKKKKKRTLPNCELWSPRWSLKLKGSKKRDKYPDLTRELKKKEWWNIKAPVIPIVNSALRTIFKGFLRAMEDLEISGQVDTIQTSSL